jgi:hypothetical protein
MSAKLTLEGVPEFHAEFDRLAETLTAEATPIVTQHAVGAAADVTAHYPEVTGNLKRGMKVTPFRTPVATGAEVVNRASHAWWYDNGTQARHYTTKANGVRHDTGAMWGGSRPPTHLFVRTMIRWRTRMDAAVRAIVEGHGVTVTGDAG